MHLIRRHGRDQLDSGLAQIGGHFVALAAARHDHRPVARLDSVQTNQPLDRASTA